MIHLTIGDPAQPDSVQIQVAELEDAYKLMEWLAVCNDEYFFTIEKRG